MMNSNVRQLFFWLAVFFTPISSSALKGSLTGTVRDARTGKPIDGASVYLTDSRAGTSTDLDGHFLIDGINDGMHLVEVSRLGYATIAVNVLIKGETRKDFQLTVSIVENNAVVVTGVSRASTLQKIPFKVEVIRKQELLQHSSMNLIEAIAEKPGLASVSTGPAIAKPLIRGMGYNRVLTINDGVRQEGQQWGDEHGIEVDDESVSKIEVLKGPASLVYGSDAMAGVINIITNQPPPNNTVQLRAGSSYQSSNNLRSLFGNFTGNRKGFNWNAYTTMKAAADYRNRFDGRVFNSKFNQFNAGGYAGYNGQWGFSHLLFSHFDLTAGMVEGERDSLGRFIRSVAGGATLPATEQDFLSTHPQSPYQHIRHVKVASDNSFKWRASRLQLTLGWQENRREEFGNPDDPEERQLYFVLRTFTYSSQLHFKETKGWKSSIGINGMSQQNTNLGIRQLIPDYRLFDGGLYLFTTKEKSRFNISGGVRADRRHVSVSSLVEADTAASAPFEKEFSNISGSAGLTYAPNHKWNFKCNIARAFRAPSIPELASAGAHEGTNRFEYGNTGLRSETSLQIDASAERSSEHFSFTLSGYYNHFGNYIYYRKLRNNSGTDSLVASDGRLLTAFTFDQQKAAMYGLEISADWHPHPLDWLHWENTFSFVRGRFVTPLEGSSNMPFMPAPRWLSEFRADITPSGKRLSNCYARYEIETTFSQGYAFTAFNTETSTKGYVLMNASVGGDLCNAKKKKMMEIYLTAKNIADVAYQSHLSRLKYAPVNPVTGRNGVFNIGRNFGIKLIVPVSF